MITYEPITQELFDFLVEHDCFILKNSYVEYFSELPIKKGIHCLHVSAGNPSNSKDILLSFEAWYVRTANTKISGKVIKIGEYNYCLTLCPMVFQLSSSLTYCLECYPI